jgi:hypothetical protein
MMAINEYWDTWSAYAGKADIEIYTLAERLVRRGLIQE